MADPLKIEAAKSAAWTGLGTGMRLGLQFVFSIVMARLLTPADFGVMAIMMMINGVAVCLIDSGFGQALIHRKNVTQAETTAVYYFGVGISVVMMVGLFVAAPWIAEFFRMPILDPVAKVLSIDFLIRSLGGVQSAMLTKDLKFKELTKISMASAIISSVLGIAMAFAGWGVWSLVVYALCTSLVSRAGFWLYSSWRPLGKFHFAPLKPLYKFGVFIFLSGLLETIFSRINTLLIGRVYSAADLGLYSRAESTQMMPQNFFAGVFNKVAFPLLATISTEPERLKAAFRKSVRLAFYLQIPAMAGLLVAADSIVRGLFGAQWVASVPFLHIFALVGLFWLPRTMNLSVLKAAGKSKEVFQTELFQKIAFVVVALATVRVGILAMVIGLAVVNAITYFLTARIAGRGVGYGGFQQVWDSRKAIIAVCIMAPLVWLLTLLSGLPPLVIMSLQIVVGFGLYLSLCYFLGVQEQQDILEHGKRIVFKRLKRNG